MRFKYFLALIKLFLVVFSLTIIDVYAGSCPKPLPPCAEFGRSSAVFIGRVIGGEDKQANQRQGETYYSYVGDVEFEILESFTGAKEKTIWISGWGGLGGSREIDDIYLIYASIHNNKLRVGSCGRTKSITFIEKYSTLATDSSTRNFFREYKKELEEDLAFLRKLPGEGSGVRIYGQVIVRDWSFGKGDGEVITPLANIAVTIKGERQSFEVKTDVDGKFELAGLDPGKYQIEASLPEGYIPPSKDHLKTDFSIRDCGCGQANFFVRSDGRVSGRVFDVEGRPLENVVIQLIPAERLAKGFKQESIGFFETKNVETDEEGRYQICDVPPGRYLLGVNIRSESPQSPHKTTFHPGVKNVSQATIISIGLGQKASPLNFSLKSDQEIQEIRGVVVWPDGQPAHGAMIEMTLANPAKRYSDDRYYTVSDEQGRFTIKGIKDHGYELRVNWWVRESAPGQKYQGPEGVKSAEAEKRVLNFSGDSGELKIVLSKIPPQ